MAEIDPEVCAQWGLEPGPVLGDRAAEQRTRGRLLAELHAAAAATGITEQRDGFTSPAEVVSDPSPLLTLKTGPQPW